VDLQKADNTVKIDLPQHNS